jgi:hypothetical protein
MPDHNYRAGDLLQCTSKYFSEQLNITSKYGIVMGTKPHHIHLWFESLKRGFWISYDVLRRVEDIEVSPLIARIQTIAYALNAEEWELETSGDVYKLICYIDEVSFETLQELRSYFDISYHSLSLYPEGMGRMIAEFEWTD